MINLMIKINLA